jgi:hypothetical protein
MKTDPAFCNHTNIKRSSKLETLSVPELGIEQLVIKVKVFCGDCKEAFIPKTMNEGFSTNEVGVVDNEIIIPLAYPIEDEIELPEMDAVEQKQDEMLQARNKEFLH